MDDPATTPIRKKRNSSIRVAANCVRDGRAQGLVSAGHTGAAMVCAKMVVGTIEGVDRPALATVLPNLKGHCLLLDVGANPDTKTPHFREFAVMGSIYAELVFRKTAPSIGLHVDRRGGLQGRRTRPRKPSRPSRTTGLNFIGNVEGARRLQRHGGRDRHRRLHRQRDPQGLGGAGRDGREHAPGGDQADAAGLASAFCSRRPPSAASSSASTTPSTAGRRCSASRAASSSATAARSAKAVKNAIRSPPSSRARTSPRRSRPRSPSSHAARRAAGQGLTGAGR